MPRTATGTFNVVLRPLEFEGAPPEAKLGRQTIDKVIAGDLAATTVGQMLAAMTATKGSAGYVAIEVVTGTLHGRAGTFVLQHSGRMDRGAPSLLVQVVPDSGTGELEGLTGNFQIDTSGGGHRYTFTYELPGAAS